MKPASSYYNFEAKFDFLAFLSWM